MEIGQVAVALSHVEPVADHPVRRDGEAHVAQAGPVHGRDRLPGQQRAHLEAGRVAGGQHPAQVGEREPGVHDVLDEQDVAILELDVEVFHDAHDAGGAGRGTVRGHGHEVDLVVDRDGPDEIAQEHERAFEHGHEERDPAAVVRADGFAQLTDALVQFGGGQQHLARPRLGSAEPVWCHGGARLPSRFGEWANQPEPHGMPLDPTAQPGVARPG